MINKKSLPVSVVLATRNGDATLESALNSIMSQSFKDFEVIVVNDCSTDNTEEILSENRSRRSIVLNKGFLL